MQYASREYIAFLIVIFFAYWALPDKIRWRVTFLVLASFFFYLAAGSVAMVTLLVMTVVVYCFSHAMAHDRARRRALLAGSLTAEIGALIVFKYLNLLLGSAAYIGRSLGIGVHETHLRILAPLGISFYSLQLASYTIDVYRGDLEPAASFSEFLCFASFFPTIVAGPILRARQLLPQLKSRIPITAETGSQALLLIAMGVVKKVVIADYLSVNFVDRVFDFPQRFSSLEVLLAIYAYAIEIYADFSGYSDIAVGSALLLGLKSPDNFNLPYRSRTLPEFWRRWHISFSTWLRDYIFFTVVRGRARSKLALYGGLFVTMVIGGLWHGADATFVVWGALHGAGLAIAHAYPALRKAAARRFRNVRTHNPDASIGIALFGSATRRVQSINPFSKLVANRGLFRRYATDGVLIFVTFHFICLTWVFFRSESVDQAFGMLGQLGQLTVDTSNVTSQFLIVLAIGYAAHWTPLNLWNRARDGFSRFPAPVQAALLFALCLGLYKVASSDVAPFIYARF